MIEAAGRSWAAFKVKNDLGVISHATMATYSLEHIRHEQAMKLQVKHLKEA